LSGLKRSLANRRIQRANSTGTSSAGAAGQIEFDEVMNPSGEDKLILLLTDIHSDIR
jgi:hypothetical protein